MPAVAQPETIVLNLQTNIDKAADAATGALGRLERQIGREGNSLARLESQLKAAQISLKALQAGEDSKAIAAFNRQSSAVDALQKKFASGEISAKSLASAQDKLSTLRAMADVKVVDPSAVAKQQSAIAILTDRIGAQKDKMAALQEKSVLGQKGMTMVGDAARSLSGTLAQSSGRAGVFLNKLIQFGPYGIAAAIAIGLVTASLFTLVGLFHKAIQSGDKLRDQFLRLQAASVKSTLGYHWLYNATRESRLGAEAMTRSIDRVAASSAVGGDKLNDYAVSIKQSQISAKNFEKVLKMAATAGAGGFDDRATEVINLAKQYQYWGYSIDDIARRIEKKLGGTAKAATLSLGTQLMKLREGIAWIFGGADIEPFLRGLNSILSLFYRGTDSATGMRGAITKLTELAIGMFLRVEIRLLQAYIWLVKHRSAVKLLQGVVVGLGMTFLAVAAVVTIALASVGATVTAFVGLLAAPFIALALLVKNWRQVWNGLKDWTRQMGARLVEGLAAGIRGAGDVIWRALKAVTHGALGLLEKLLEIASPSRRMFRLGVQVPRGMAGGIVHAQPAVMGASARMATSVVTGTHMGFRASLGTPSPAASLFRAQMQAPSPAQSGGHSVTFQNCTFGDTTNEGLIRRWVLSALEGESLNPAVT